MRTVKGFTLVELMVTIAVLGIIASIAVPNLSNWVDSSSARSQVNLYRDMLTYARAEAISKGQLVRVKQLGDKTWVVGTGDPADCSAATALRCFPAPTGKAGIRLTGFPIQFTSQGQVKGGSLTGFVPPSIAIKFTDNCAFNRDITVNGIGRIRSQKGGC